MINSGDGAGVGGQPEVEVTESVTRGSSDSVDLLVAALQQVCDQRRMTLAVAESLTAGAIQAAIGRHRGVSGFFLGGVVTYDIAVKAAVLGVDLDEAEPVDAVSDRVACQMAEGVRRLIGSDVGVAVTGWAEADVPHLVPFPRAAYAVAAPGLDEPTVGWVIGPGADRASMIEQVVVEVLQAAIAVVTML